MFSDMKGNKPKNDARITDGDIMTLFDKTTVPFEETRYIKPPHAVIKDEDCGMYENAELLVKDISLKARERFYAIINGCNSNRDASLMHVGIIPCVKH